MGASSMGEAGKVIDSLLPPGVDAAPGAMRPLPVPKPPEDKKAAAPLKVGDKPKKKVRLGPGGEEQELKELSREEKSARRFRRNLILWSVCVAILGGVMWFMMWR